MVITKTKTEAEAAYHEMSAMVTDLTSAWWNVELTLAMLLTAISNMRHTVADVVLGTVTANKVKRDIVLNVANIMLANHADVKKVEKVLGRMARAASTRNKFSHASFGITFKRGFKLKVMSVDATEREGGLFYYHEYSKKELENFLHQFQALSNDVANLAFALKKARRRRRLESWKL